MWEETLIESKGKRIGKRAWVTAALSVSVHVVLVTLIIAGSFWYLEAVQPQALRPVLYTTAALPTDTIPVALRKGTPEGNNLPVKPAIQESTATPQAEPAQDQINPNANPELGESATTPFDPAAAGPIGTGPQGDPHGTAEDGPLTGQPGDGITSPMIVEGEVQPPVLLHKVQPEYPGLARAAHIEGIVVLRAIISRTGDVDVRDVVQSAHPILEREAIKAVNQWKYRPARFQNRPVSVWFTVTVSFKLQ